MIKKIIEPLSNVGLYIYYGESGKKSFVNLMKKFKVKHDMIDDQSGLHYTNNIYIEDIQDINTIIHEYIHFLDWLTEYLEISKEPEFRAYISGYLVKKILELSNKEKLKVEE